MIAPGIHETASGISNTETITLTAGTGRAEMQVDGVYSTDDRVQYVIRHTTQDEMEAGYGVYAGTNQLKRSRPLQTDSGPATSRRTFSTGTVDVYISPARGGLFPNVSAIAATGKAALYSEHVPTHVGTLAATVNRVVCIPFRRSYVGQITALRDHVTTTAGTKYRWAIRRASLSTGLPDEEIWQSGDLTPTVGARDISCTAFEYSGEPLWLLVLADGALVQKSISNNYIGPTHAGILATNSKNVTDLYDDIAPGWSAIPASGSLSLSANGGDVWKPALVPA